MKLSGIELQAVCLQVILINKDVHCRAYKIFQKKCLPYKRLPEQSLLLTARFLTLDRLLWKVVPFGNPVQLVQ